MEPITGESILHKGIVESHEKVNPNQAIDVTMIIGIVSSIFEMIRGCSSPASASRQIKRGKSLAYRSVKKALKKQGYEGNVKKVAREIAEKGRDLSEEEIQMILDDAADVPQPPPKPGGLWPLWVLLPLLLMPSFAQAGLWPVVEDKSVEVAQASIWPVTYTVPQDEPEKILDRMYIMTAEGCPPCKEALDRLQKKDGPFDKLKESGWLIGTEGSVHIQIVDVDKSNIDDRLGVHYTPAFVMVKDGQVVRRIDLGCGTVIDSYALDWLYTGVQKKAPATEKLRVATSGNYPVHGMRWNFEGRWNPSKSFMVNHLKRVHNYRGRFNNTDLNKWTKAELWSAHDDIHEGHYNPSSVKQAAAEVRVQKSRSYCPTCPQYSRS